MLYSSQMVLFLCQCRIGAKKSNHFVSSLLFLQIDKKNTFFLDLKVESFGKICVSFLLFLQIDLATSYVKRLLSQDKLTNLASLCTFPHCVIFFLQNLSSLNTFYTKLPQLVWSEEMLGLKDEHRFSVQKTLTRWTISDGVCCWENFCHTSSVEVELLPQEHLSKYVRGASSKPLRKLLTAWNPSDRERTQIHLQNVQELMKMQNYVTWSIITIFVDQSFSNN